MTSLEDDPDYAAPTMLFSGESITVGHGLPWEDTYPAIVGKAFGLQVVDPRRPRLRERSSVRPTRRPARALQERHRVVSIFPSPMLVRMREKRSPAPRVPHRQRALRW